MNSENVRPSTCSNSKLPENLPMFSLERMIAANIPQQSNCQSKEGCKCERSKDEKNQESDALKDLSEYLKKYQIQDDAISKELKQTLHTIYRLADNICNYWNLENSNSVNQSQEIENLESVAAWLEKHRIKHVNECLTVKETLKSVESASNGHKFTVAVEMLDDIFSNLYTVRQTWNQDSQGMDKVGLYGLFKTAKAAIEFSEKLLGFYRELNATESHEPAVPKSESELDKINKISLQLEQYYISQADMTKALTNCTKVPNVLKSGIFNFDADNKFVLTLEKYDSVSCSGSLYAVRQSFNGKDNTVYLFGMFKDDIGTALECFYSVLEYSKKLRAYKASIKKAQNPNSDQKPDSKKEPEKIVNFNWLAKETEKHKILNANAVKALLTKYTRVFSVSTMTHEFAGLHKQSEHLYKISVELEGTPKTGYNPLVRAEFFSDGVLMDTVFYSDFDDLTAATKFSEHLKQYYVSLLKGSFTDL